MDNRIIILVTDQKNCARLVKAGHMLRMMDYPGYSMRVLSVQPRDRVGVGAPALQYLFDVSSEADAEMIVLYSDDPVQAAIEYIGQSRAMHIVHGQNASGRSEFIEELKEGLPGRNFCEIPYPIMLSEALMHCSA